MEKEITNGLGMRWFILFLLVIQTAVKASVLIGKWQEPVSPVMVDYVKRLVEKAETENFDAIILTLDTPGGLAKSMREVIKLINNTRIPFIVFVYPQGAQATSAGAIITVSADLAVMSPLTNIGSASPVSMQGKDIDKTMKKKVVNDMLALVRAIAKEKGRNTKAIEKMITEAKNYSAKEALKLKIIDFIANDISEVIKKAKNREIKKLGQTFKVKITDEKAVFLEKSFIEKLLIVLTNPTIAYFLLMIGFYGIFFELYNPGSIIPGTIGAISFVLALYSLNMIDVNWLGVILIGLGVLFFALELITPTFGGLTLAGVLSIVLGSAILFNPHSPYGDISIYIIIPVVLFSTVFFLAVSYFGLKAQRKKSITGIESIVGRKAKALTDINPEGKVMIDGEIWNAYSDELINKEEEVIIEKVEGLKLKVRKAK